MRISDWSSDVCSSDLFDPLHLALMDDGEKLVLDVRPASADLVKNNRACAPYCRWRLDVLQAPVPSRHREPYQVVEIEQARVVMPKLQPERAGDTVEKQALGGAVRPDQK